MSKNKAIYLSIIVLFLGILTAVGSYAYWSWASETPKRIVFNTATDLSEYIEYDDGDSVFSGDFQIGDTYTDGIHSTISIKKTNDVANIDLYATIFMDVNQIGPNMRNSRALKWVVTSGNSDNPGQVLSNGNFIGANAGDTLTLLQNIEVLTTVKEFTIWIWLDRAENPSDALSGETLDTTVWTEITQPEGIEDVFEITQINAYYQTITATVVNNRNDITNYAVTTTTGTPSSWQTITEPGRIYNLTYTASTSGTYYVWFKDSEGNIVSKSVTVDSVDTSAPSCSFGNWSVTPIKNGDTSQIVLTCTDPQSDISVYNLTTSSLTKSNNNITVSNITRTRVTNGYAYTITVTATSADGTTTLTLPANSVKNGTDIGNEGVTSSAITTDSTAPAPTISGGETGKQTSITFSLSCTDGNGVTGWYFGTTAPSASSTFTTITSTTNMTGKTGTANSATTYYLGCIDGAGNIGSTNVVVDSYVVSNMLLNLNGTKGTYNTSHYTRSGNATTYYIKNNVVLAPSNVCTTPTGGDSLLGYNLATPGSSTVTLTGASTNITFNGNKNIGCWYNRKEYEVDVTSGANGSVTATTVTQNGNSVTASAGTTQTLIVRHGDTVTGTATATTGYTFSGWSGYLTGTTSPATGTAVTANKKTTNGINASFGANTYTIAYAGMTDATHGTNHPTSGTYNADVQISNPTKTGYTFMGWTSSSADGLGTNAKSGTSANPSASWNGTTTKNTYFRNLRNTSGTVTLTATWGQNNYINVDTNVYYESLNNALSKVLSNQTIKALNSITESFADTTVTLASGKTGVKFDLNGKTITLGGKSITNNGTLDIYNSSSTPAVLQGNNANDCVGLIHNYGTLTTNATSSANAITISNGSNSQTAKVIFNHNGTVTLNSNTTITFTTASVSTTVSRYLIFSLGGTVNISGATLINTATNNNNVDGGITISGNQCYSGSAASGRVVMASGSITTYGDAINNVAATGTTNPAVEITGGNITASKNGIYNGSTGTIKVTGGTVTGSFNGIQNASTGTIVIGNDDGSVSTTIPEINSTASSSSYYGINIASGGAFNFYDGKITSAAGTGHALNSNANSVVNTPTGYRVVKSVVDGSEIAVLGREYTVTLDKCSGTSNGTTSVTATYNSTTISPATITLAGKSYTISGFTLGSTATGATLNPTSPSTLTSSATLNGYYTACSGGSKILNANTTATWNNTTVSGYLSSGKWIGTEDKTIYAQFGNMSSVTLPTITKDGHTCKWKDTSTNTEYESGATITPTANMVLEGVCSANSYLITIKAGNGMSSVSATGWTNTGSGTMTKTLNFGDTITLCAGTASATAVVGNRKTGYTGCASTLTTGAGTLSGNTYTVGSGTATITLAATGISTPTCAISGGDTKVYNYQTTELTGSNSTSYDSGINLTYEFGYTTSSTGTLGNYNDTNYMTVSGNKATVKKDAYLGTRYFGVKVVASDGTLTSSTCTTATSGYTTMTLQRVQVIFSVSTEELLNGDSGFYVYYGSGNMYKTATGNTAASIPTISKLGYTWKGWYTSRSGGSRVINTTPALTGTAVANWTNASKQWVPTVTDNKILYAQYDASTYNVSLNKGTCLTNGTASITATYDSSSISPATITLAKKVYTISGFELAAARNSDSATVSSTATINASGALSGYYSANSGGSKILNASTTATWNNVTVSGYLSNGKWVKDGAATLYARCGDIPAQTLPTITKTGYTCGWTTSSSGTTIEYASGGSLTPTANTVLYGVCIANNYQNTTTNEYYDTLAEAFSAVASNQTIKALNNTTETVTPTLASGKTGVKLDLNGKTITLQNQTLANNGGLDIYNSSSTAAALSYGEISLISNTGTLTINGTSSTNVVTLSANQGDIIEDSGTLTINSNVVINCIAGMYDGITIASGGALTVNGGTFNGTDMNNGIYNNGGTVIVNSGTFNYNYQDSSPIYNMSGQVTINGGNYFMASLEGIYNKGTMIITGGTIDGFDGVTNDTASASLTMTGGTISADQFGIMNDGGIVTLGENDGNVSITTPAINSDLNGIDNRSGSTFNFYDGIITSTQGTGYAINDVVTPNVPSGYAVQKTTSGGVETAILVPIAPTITGGATKVYNYEATTLTCSNTATYFSGYSKYYEFGWSSNSNGTSITWLGSPSTTDTYSVAKSAFLGTRYYYCRMYVSNGTNTSTTSVSTTPTTMKLQRVKVSFDATTNSGTLSGTSPIYVYYGSGNMYTTATGSTTTSMPTASKDGSTWNGWYTASSGGSKVANTTPTLTGTAVTNWTNASKQWVITTTTDKTLYAQFTVNKAVVKIYKDGSQWTTSNPGINVALYQNGSVVYTYANGTKSSDKSQVTWNNVTAGTYDIYVSKDVNRLTTLVDSGTDLIVTSDATKTINLYTLKMTGTNMSALTLNTTAVTSGNSVVVLGNVNHNIGGTVATGFTFNTWSKTSGTVTFGSETTLSTTVKVTASSEINAAATGNTYTATFYYQSDGTAGSQSVSSIVVEDVNASNTTSCRVQTGHSNCTVTIPAAVKSSVGTHNNDYAGLATTAGTMSTSGGATQTATTVTLSANTSYFAVYSSQLTIHYPTSTTAATTTTAAYRNQWLSSTSAMATTVIATSAADTSNSYLYSSGLTEYSLYGFASAHSTNTPYSYNGTSTTTVARLRATDLTDAYVVLSKSVTATFYYSGDVTGTKTSTTEKGVTVTPKNQYVRCSNATTGAEIYNTSLTIPTMTGEVLPYGTTRVGWTTPGNTGTMTTATPTTAQNEWYAVYSKAVTIYYPKTTTTRDSYAYFRNSYLASTTASSYTTVIAVSATSTSMTGLSAAVDGYSFYGYATAAGTNTRIYSNTTNLATNVPVSGATAPDTAPTTVYLIIRKAVTATLYYSSDSTDATISSLPADAKYQYIRCTSTAAELTNSTVSVPSALVHAAPSGTTFRGWATSLGTMTTTTLNTANTTYYAVYGAEGTTSNITIYYPSSLTAASNYAYFRNAYIANSDPMPTTYTRVIATSATGTSNFTFTSSVSGWSFYRFTNAFNTVTYEYPTGSNTYITTVAKLASSPLTTTYVSLAQSQTPTFYYNGSSGKTSTPGTARNRYITTKTATTAGYNEYKFTVPDVSHSAPYGTSFVGWSSSASTIPSSFSDPTTISNSWYAVYRANITVYRPSSTSACTTEASYYRNSFYGTGTAYTNVLTTSGTSTSNAAPTMVSGYTFLELRTAAAAGGTAYTLANAAKTSTTTFYAREYKDITATLTVHYNSNTTSGSFTAASKSADGTVRMTLHCTSTTAAGTSNASQTAATIPTEATGSLGKYNTPYHGLADSVGSMSATVAKSATTVAITGDAIYYAIYGGGETTGATGYVTSKVTVYRPSSASACTTQQFYRNEFFSSASAMSTVLSTSTTGTTNSTPTMVSGYTFLHLRTAAAAGGTAYTVAEAAPTATTTFYTREYKDDPVTLTVYYNSNATSGSFTAASKTASGTARTTLHCTSTTAAGTSVASQTAATIPTAATGSLGKYNTPYHGLANAVSRMTADVAKSSTTVAISGDATYYAIYGGGETTGATGYVTSKVTFYRPSSTSACTTQQFYRNEFFTSTSEMSTILSTSTTGTVNQSPTEVTGYSFSGSYAKKVTTAASLGGTAYNTVGAAATTTTTTFYASERKDVTITGTFYYNSNATSGSTTVANKTASNTAVNTLYCTSTTAATTSQASASITIPSEVTGSVGTYNNAYVGVSASTGNMTPANSSGTVSTAADKTYYAIYRSSVTNNYYNSSYTSRTLYRNQWFSSTTAMADPVLSTTTTGTSNVSTATGPGSSVWYGLATTATNTRDYSSFASAAKSGSATLHTIYTMNITYAKGSNVDSIGSTTGSCRIHSTSTTAGQTSCSVTLPTITPTSGYSSVGWSATSGATTGTAAGESYTNSSNSTKLYANAVQNTYTITIRKDGSAWSASGMKISLSNSTSSNSDTRTATVSSGSTATFNGIPTGTTYYVWAGKYDGAKTTMVYTGYSVTGSVGATRVINYYTISRSQGAGTTLTTKLDSSSGTAFTSAIVVLGNNKVTIYGAATRKTGYSGTVTLKHGSTSMTASGSTFTVSAKETITSGGVTANQYTVSFYAANVYPGLESGGSGTLTQSGSNYTLTTSTQYGGARIPYSTFVEGKFYRFQYTLQKTSGTLSKIGGHSESGYNPSYTKFYIDGTQQDWSTYQDPGNNLANNTTAHTILLEFKWSATNGYNGNSVSDKNIYVQPNRGITTSVTVTLSNLSLYQTETSKTVTYASTYGTLPTPTRSGYTFDGWYTAESGGTKIESTTTVSITSNQILYGHWTLNKNCYQVVSGATTWVRSSPEIIDTNKLTTISHPTYFRANSYNTNWVYQANIGGYTNTYVNKQYIQQITLPNSNCPNS